MNHSDNFRKAYSDDRFTPRRRFYAQSHHLILSVVCIPGKFLGNMDFDMFGDEVENSSWDQLVGKYHGGTFRQNVESSDR